MMQKIAHSFSISNVQVCPKSLFPKVINDSCHRMSLTTHHSSTITNYSTAGDWICSEHPNEHPSAVFCRYLSWELELRSFAVSSPEIQTHISSFVGSLSEIQLQTAVIDLANYHPDSHGNR